MTAETNIMNNVPLLPLPKAHNLADYGDVPVRGYDNEQLQAYARANVAHALAKKQEEVEFHKLDAGALHVQMDTLIDSLAARDAEVEALRAEVAILRERLKVAQQQTTDALSIIGANEAIQRANDILLQESEASAERLAGALRGWIWARENGASEELAEQYARAALDQENDDA